MQVQAYHASADLLCDMKDRTALEKIVGTTRLRVDFGLECPFRVTQNDVGKRSSIILWHVWPPFGQFFRRFCHFLKPPNSFFSGTFKGVGR